MQARVTACSELLTRPLMLGRLLQRMQAGCPPMQAVYQSSSPASSFTRLGAVQAPRPACCQSTGRRCRS